MIKKSIVCITMVGMVALALASSGGGGNKKRANINTGFAPSASSTGFTLKAGSQFAGSKSFTAANSKNFVLYNTLTTYQKGNTVYILPYKYKISKPEARSNFNVLDLKFRLRK